MFFLFFYAILIVSETQRFLFILNQILRYLIDRIYILSFTQSPLRGFVFSNAKSGIKSTVAIVRKKRSGLLTQNFEDKKFLNTINLQGFLLKANIGKSKTSNFFTWHRRHHFKIPLILLAFFISSSKSS